MKTTRVLRWALVLCALWSAPQAADAEDDWYTVWTRGTPTLKPSGIKDHGWVDGANRFINTVEAGPGQVRVLFKSIKGGRVEKHVTCDLRFSAPPKQLRVGDSFHMKVQGRIARLDSQAFYAEVAWARLHAAALGIDQRHKLSAGTPTLAWDLSTKVTRAPTRVASSSFDVYVELGPGRVTWTYRPQKVRVRTQDRGGAVGKVVSLDGVAEQLERSSRRWVPLTAGATIKVGTTIRTKGTGFVHIRWNRPLERGHTETAIGGRDSLVRIEDNARPEQPRFVLTFGILHWLRRHAQGVAAAEVVRLQAGDITFVPEGTEFLMLHDRSTRTVACYVREGRVRLQGAQGQALRLEAGQQVAAARGVFGVPQAMRPLQWDALLRPLRPREKAAPAPPVSAGSFHPTVRALRFFESGKGVPPVKQRSYGVRFSTRTARFVNWELALTYALQPRRRTFDVVARWYRQDGKLLTAQTLKAYADKGWRESLHANGWGWADAGKWQPGKHRVDLHVGGVKISSGYFWITP